MPFIFLEMTTVAFLNETTFAPSLRFNFFPSHHESSVSLLLSSFFVAPSHLSPGCLSYD
jgi:hypothetical protein